MNNWPPGYYVYRDRLGLAMLILYAVSKNLKIKPYVDLYSQLIISVIMGLTPIFIYAYIRKYPINMVYLTLTGIPNTMSYVGPIEWGLFTTILNYRILTKIKDGTLAAITATYSTLVGGYIYEIPIFIKNDGPLSVIRLNANNTFFFSIQIISIPILYYIIKKEIKPDKNNTIKAVLIYLTYFALALPENLIHSIMPFIGFWKWTARIPTMIALSLILTPKQQPPPKEKICPESQTCHYFDQDAVICNEEPWNCPRRRNK